MYRRPEHLDKRISDETFEKIMDIAHSESESFLSFGGLWDHFERAVQDAANAVVRAEDEAKAKKKRLVREQRSHGGKKK
jgi:hypothetical protein